MKSLIINSDLRNKLFQQSDNQRIATREEVKQMLRWILMIQHKKKAKWLKSKKIWHLLWYFVTTVNLEEEECCWVPRVSSMMDTKKSISQGTYWVFLKCLTVWLLLSVLDITNITLREIRTVSKKCALKTNPLLGIDSLASSKTAPKTSTSMARTSSWTISPNSKSSLVNLKSS